MVILNVSPEVAKFTNIAKSPLKLPCFIIKELEESDFEKDKKGKFSVNKKGKTSIQLDF